MKLLTLALFLCFSFIGLAQTNDEMSRDTARANRLFEEAESDSLSARDPRVLELFEEAASLYRKYPFMIESLPAIINHFAIHDLQRRDYEWTDSTGNKIIQEMKAKGLSEHPSLFRVYTVLANRSVQNSTVKKTAFYWGEAAKIAKNTDAPIDNYCRSILLQSNFLRIDSDIRFLPLLMEADSIIKTNPDNISKKRYKFYYYLKGVYYLDYTKEMEKAIIMFNKRIKYVENIADYKHTKHFFKLAEAYAVLNDKEQTYKNVNKGLEYVEKIRVDTTIDYFANRISYFYLQAAETFHIIYDYDKSIEYAEKALEVHENSDEKGNVGHAYYRLAMVYLALDKIDKSIEMAERALIHNRGCTHLEVYAEALVRRGDYNKAIEIAQEAFTLFLPDFQPTSVFENPPFTYEAFHIREWALFSKTEALYKKAITGNSINYEILQYAIESCQLFLKGVDIGNANYFRTSELSLFVRNKSRSKYAKYLIDAYYHYFQKDKNREHLEKLLYYAEYYKGQTVIESIYKGSIPKEDLAKEAAFLRRIRLLEQNLVFADSSMKAGYQDQLFAVTDKYGVFRLKLKEQYPISSEDIRKTTFASSSDIQTNLAQGEALISYVQGEEALFILFFTKDDFEIKKVSLSDNFSNTIEELVKIVKHPLNLYDNKRKKFIQHSHQLYEILIAPIKEQLTGIQQLTIIPDNKLFHLPFEILLKSDENKAYHELDYLIKDFAISYNYSASIHTLNQQNKKELKDFSFLGFAPVFSKGQTVAVNRLRSLNISVDSLQRSVEGNAFVHLPNTKRELIEIEKILPKNEKTTLLFEAKASKKAVYDLIEQPYHFLHFATHGIVNPDKNKYSSLISYTEDKNSLDRFLFVNEIQTKAIQADLVVLSSCESGVGDLKVGEGLIAFNRGFIYAGANNVLFTLWKINDFHSSNLMIDFYKNYMENRSYSKALQAAKVNFLGNELTANPRFWSAFQLIGF